MLSKDYNAVASIDIKAPVEKVWDALTSPDFIKRYLHDTNTITDWRIGSQIKWQGVWDGKPYEDKGVVLDFQPNKLLKTTHWSPMSGTEDIPENYHVVTYELRANGNVTHLVLTQSNNSTQEAADSMAEKGWKPILQIMKSLLET
ncbi:MAG: SRPBCC domain-containing protein [Candidatus Saccharimonadales bacterium]